MDLILIVYVCVSVFFLANMTVMSSLPSHNIKKNFFFFKENHEVSKTQVLYIWLHAVLCLWMLRDTSHNFCSFFFLHNLLWYHAIEDVQKDNT